MPKITPFLWFDDQAEEAAEFYVSVFNARPGSAGDSEILGVSRYGEAGPGKPGSAMTVSFRLEGQEFTGLNGGPHHSFNEGPCGWLRDRYGLSWQIIPSALGELLGDPDPERAARAMQAMLQMTKLDIQGLRRAAEAA